MSEERQTENIPAIDQAARTAQAEAPEIEIQTEEDVVTELRRKLEELEARDRKLEEDNKRAKRAESDARAASAAAEARAREAERSAAQTADAGRRGVDEARLAEFTSSLTSHQGQMEALETQYAAAFSEGDGPKMAKIQTNMARIGARIESLEAGKAQLEARRTQPMPDRPQETGDPREAFIRQQPSLVQDWLRAHPNYFDDTAFQRRVAAVANYAQTVKNIPIDSQDYIDYVNEELGLTQRRADPDPSPNSAPPPAGRNPDTSGRLVAAPAGGSVPNSSRASGRDGTAVYLTAQQKEAARWSGVSEVEYAKAVRDLDRENLIGPNANNRR